MSKEDELVNSLIQYHRNRTPIGEDAQFVEKQFTPEAHYDHYGNRGAADLHARMKSKEGIHTYTEDYLYEFKGAAAIRASTGANEIIRQFNRMRNYFYKDESISRPDRVHCELTFTIEPETVAHVINNYEMYNSIHATDVMSTRSMEAGDQAVLFRTPGVDEPAHISLGKVSLSNPREYADAISGGVRDKMAGVVKSVLDEE